MDLEDLIVKLVLTTTDVGALELTLTSPDETSVGLWDLDGGDVEWSEQTVTFYDLGAEIPELVPETCGDECFFSASGPGSFADFYAEDAGGEWTLEAASAVEVTLHDWCMLVQPDEYTYGSSTWIRGDVNGNGTVSPIIDALALLQWRFGDADEPPCLVSADVNGDGKVRALVDSVYLLHHFFGDGDAPPAPFPLCGRADPSYPDIYVPCPGDPELPPDHNLLTCFTPTVCP